MRAPNARLALSKGCLAFLCCSLVAACTSSGTNTVNDVLMGVDDSGPMASVSRHMYSLTLEPGGTFTDGAEVLELEGGTEPARITKIRSVGGSESLELIGAKIAGIQRKHGYIQAFRMWPPPNAEIGTALLDAEGAVLQPKKRLLAKGARGSTYELFLGYRLLNDKLAVRDAVEVYYTVGGRKYVSRREGIVMICPASMSGEDCDAAMDARFFEG